MNVLVLSNMAPSAEAPYAGIFVQNQVDILSQCDSIDQLGFIAIRSVKKGGVALIKKYGLMLWHTFSQGIFSRTRYDVLHVHYFYPTIWFAIIYKLLRNPRAKIVVTFHGGDVYSFKHLPLFYRLAARFIDKGIFVSEGLKQRFFTELDESAVLCAGILPCFVPQQVEKSIDLLMVGSVAENKGMDRLKLILQRFDKPLRILVIGDGPYAEQLKRWQFAQHHFEYIARQSAEHLVEKYNQSRYLLSLSRNESFGLVMAEAMACGTPVLATDTDGAKTQVIAGVNGFLIANEPDAIASACKVIEQSIYALEPEQYQRLQQGAIATAKQHLLPEVAKTLLGHYQSVLSKS